MIDPSQQVRNRILENAFNPQTDRVKETCELDQSSTQSPVFERLSVRHGT